MNQDKKTKIQGKKDKRNSEDPEKLSRRKFIKRAIFGSIAMFSLSTGFYTFIFEPWNIQVERFNLKIPNLPGYWKGKKLVQVSDIHCSRVVKYDFLKKAFDLVIKENPDIIALTGDYVTGGAKYVDYLNKALKETVSPKENIYKIAVPGNHDYWTSIDYITKSLEDCGFTMLADEKAVIGPGDSRLTILGADDLWTKGINLDTLLEDFDITKEAAVLLSHNPDIFPEAVKAGIPVTISGHSHGGQVNLPIIGTPLVPTKYVRGFFREKDNLMYVNRGLGLLNIPVRFDCSPEITVFTLH